MRQRLRDLWRRLPWGRTRPQPVGVCPSCGSFKVREREPEWPNKPPFWCADCGDKWAGIYSPAIKASDLSVRVLSPIRADLGVIEDWPGS